MKLKRFFIALLYVAPLSLVAQDFKILPITPASNDVEILVGKPNGNKTNSRKTTIGNLKDSIWIPYPTVVSGLMETNNAVVFRGKRVRETNGRVSYVDMTGKRITIDSIYSSSITQSILNDSIAQINNNINYVNSKILDSDDFQALGDNNTDNYPALTNYAAYCRTNNAPFRLRKGIYKVSLPINLSGLIIEGNNCTLKRWQHLGSAGNITSNYSGGTTIQVTNGSVFKVGQSVSMCSGDSHPQQNADAELTRTITAISGNIITINSAWTTSYTVGTGKLFTNFGVIAFSNGSSGTPKTVDTVKSVVRNLIVDGNSTNGVVNYAWSVNTMISISYHDVAFYNCRFQNTSNECIMTTNKISLIGCSVKNLNGGVCHITGSSPYNSPDGSNEIIIDGLTGEDVNLIPVAKTIHSEAFFTFSVFVKNVKISNCRVSNGGEMVFGTGNETTENVIVENNEFYNFKKIGIIQRNKNYKIQNNIFHTCGDLGFYWYDATVTDSTQIGEIRITGNRFINGKLMLTNTANVFVLNNTFETKPAYWFSSYPVETNPPTNIYSRNAQISVVSDSKNVKIRGNTIIKPQNINTEFAGVVVETCANNGAMVSGAGNYLVSENIDISDNLIKGYSNGIYAGGYLGAYTAYSWTLGGGKNLKGLVVSNNTIHNIDSSAYTGLVVGIKASSGAIVKGNTIYQPTISAATNFYGIAAYGSDAITKDGCVIMNNIVIHKNAVRCQVWGDYSNSYKMVVAYNSTGDYCTDTSGVYGKHYFVSLNTENTAKYYFKENVASTSVDVSTTPTEISQGFQALASTDFTNVQYKAAHYDVVVNGEMYTYKSTATSTSGLTWSVSGTTITPKNGTASVTITNIKVIIRPY